MNVSTIVARIACGFSCLLGILQVMAVLREMIGAEGSGMSCMYVPDMRMEDGMNLGGPYGWEQEPCYFGVY